LVSEIDAARLLGIGRAQVKELIADRHLRLVDVNGLPRVTTASIVAYVDQLAAEHAG
jgi:hypothetical protein